MPSSPACGLPDAAWVATSTSKMLISMDPHVAVLAYSASHGLFLISEMQGVLLVDGGAPLTSPTAQGPT